VICLGELHAPWAAVQAEDQQLSRNVACWRLLVLVLVAVVKSVTALVYVPAEVLWGVKVSHTAGLGTLDTGVCRRVAHSPSYREIVAVDYFDFWEYFKNNNNIGL
jgi:hypothetical protein